MALRHDAGVERYGDRSLPRRARSRSMISRLYCVLILAGIAVSYGSAAHPCVSCHPKQVAGYQKTGMGRSLQRVARQPGGRFTHALSGSEFQIRSGPEGMVHTLEREGAVGKFSVDYVIGSGNHAFGYLVNVGGYLFQSPISYY